MGPLAVRTDRQGEGIGRVIVQTAVDWLRDHGASTIGLETMPRTVENIGFYSRLGFTPGHLTVTMTREAGSPHAGEIAHLADRGATERAERIAACRAALQGAAPGYDFSRELELTHNLRVGDTIIVERGGGVCGFALYHAVPLADIRTGDELRVLKLFADGRDAFASLLTGLEAAAARHHLHRVAIRCQTGFEDAYRALIARGYRVRWTDLRMTLVDYAEPAIGDGAVVFSNWEI